MVMGTETTASMVGRVLESCLNEIRNDDSIPVKCFKLLSAVDMIVDFFPVYASSASSMATQIAVIFGEEVHNLANLAVQWGGESGMAPSHAFQDRDWLVNNALHVGVTYGEDGFVTTVQV